jgi:hypothetical protein
VVSIGKGAGDAAGEDGDGVVFMQETPEQKSHCRPMIAELGIATGGIYRLRHFLLILAASRHTPASRAFPAISG